MKDNQLTINNIDVWNDVWKWLGNHNLAIKIVYNGGRFCTYLGHYICSLIYIPTGQILSIYPDGRLCSGLGPTYIDAFEACMRLCSTHVLRYVNEEGKTVDLQFGQLPDNI